MKYWKLIAALLLSACSSTSFGLSDANAPTKIQIPFGNGAGGSYIRTIPVASQIGIQNGAASYTDGFPPLNFVPVNAGGVPPFGQDMNGILRDVSAHARWWAAGGPVYYDGTYQTAIGGYPKGAIVQSTVTTGLLWVSTTENNITNPDTGGAGWLSALTSSSPSVGIGYATGAGGSVTQTGSVSNPVTINKITGVITTVAATYNSGSSYVFQVNDSSVGSNDVVMLSIHSASTVGYLMQSSVQAGFFNVQIYSIANHGTDAPVITFVVLKGSNN